MIQERDTFAKALDRNAFIVTVHARLSAVGEGEGIQAIGLNLVEAKAGGIGRPGGKERKSDGPGKILRGDALDGFVQWARDVGRRRVFARVGGELEPDLRVADDLAAFPGQLSGAISGEQWHPQSV